jgi:RES domain-containing protein
VDLWRISNHASLAGDGGLRASGRWHTRGRRIVYCAESPAAALLEILVHLEIEMGDVPVRYRLLRIGVPAAVKGDRVDPTSLPAGWVTRTPATRAVGDDWIARGAGALLHVPSAIVPYTFNVLLNPAHRDASRITVAEITGHLIDRRLVNAGA